MQHDPKAFKVGDRVRVTGKAAGHGHGHGWYSIWNHEMDHAIGNTYTVLTVGDGKAGFELDTRGDTMRQNYWFPSFVLEKAADTLRELLEPATLADTNEPYIVVSVTFNDSASGKLYDYRCPTRFRACKGDTLLVDTPYGTDKPVTVVRSRVYDPSNAWHTSLKTIKAIKRRKPYGNPAKLVIGDAISAREYGRLLHETISQHNLVFGVARIDNPLHNPPKEATPMSQKPLSITTKTMISGGTLAATYDAAQLSDDQLFEQIAQAEAEIERLNKIKRKPATLKTRIEALEAGVIALGDLIDARNPDLPKPAGESAA